MNHSRQQPLVAHDYGCTTFVPQFLIPSISQFLILSISQFLNLPQPLRYIACLHILCGSRDKTDVLGFAEVVVDVLLSDVQLIGETIEIL